MRSSTLLPGVRACHLMACLEHVVAVARQLQHCPTRPKLIFFTLLEPAEQHLPFFLRGNPDLVLGIYDCELHLIDAGTAPLVSLRAARSQTCPQTCTGKCTGDLHVELYVSELFTLKEFEVRLIIAETLELYDHPWAHVLSVWDTCVHKPHPAAPASARPPHTEPSPSGPLPAEPVPSHAENRPLAELRSFFSRRLPSTEYLFVELLKLKDPHDNAHLFTPWLEHIKADYDGEYPAYPRRTFDLACDRCIARMKKEGKYRPPPPTDKAAD